MTIFNRLRILPLLVIVALWAFMVRANLFVDDVKTINNEGIWQEALNAPSGAEEGDDYVQAAFGLAELAPASGGDKKKKDDHQKEDDGHGADDEAEGAGEDSEDQEEVNMSDHLSDPSLMEDAPSEKIDWQDAGDTDFSFSGVKEELYKDLTKRRQDLEAQERQLALREALLEAGERELEQKMRELEILRNELQGLLEKQTEEEQARIAKLVKIYEGMKAKDAAQIFNTLDMNVLIQVMALMSERKSSPILAAMSPERARAVTILLAEQKQLPSLAP